MKSILVATASSQIYSAMKACFQSGVLLAHVPSKGEALETLRENRHDLVFIDLDLLSDPRDPAGYKAAFGPFWGLYPMIGIIVMASEERIRDAVMAVKAGAGNYVTYPFRCEEVRYVAEEVQVSAILQSELDYLRDRFWKIDSLEIVQTRSARMKAVFDKIRSVAPTKSTVLLMGETGTGKGVLARLIHRHSNRSDAQFISLHCGAIPDTLIESELFGHEKGAFTGAVRRKLGKFEIAKGGTIFLDEIATITPATQIKLLQVLQEGTFQRVGGEEEIQANTRVISASNIDLKRLTESGEFRKDLFYRLNVFPIEIPPLRERAEDIPFFVDVFLKKLNQFNTKNILSVHPQVLSGLQKYDWPGNIRELENLMERAYILETSSELSPESFPGELFDVESGQAAVRVDPSVTLAEVRKRGIRELERNYLKEVLTRHRGRINDSANTADISTRQLHKLMQKYGLHKEAFKDEP